MGAAAGGPLLGHQAAGAEAPAYPANARLIGYPKPQMISANLTLPGVVWQVLHGAVTATDKHRPTIIFATSSGTVKGDLYEVHAGTAVSTNHIMPGAPRRYTPHAQYYADMMCRHGASGYRLRCRRTRWDQHG